MKKTLHKITIISLTLFMVLSFASCSSNKEQTYIDEVKKAYDSIITEADKISEIDTSTESGYKSMIEGLESVNQKIVELSELDTPEKYADVQKGISAAADKIKESIDLFKAIDLDSEEAISEYEEAYAIYLEGGELFKQAIEDFNAVNKE